MDKKENTPLSGEDLEAYEGAIISKKKGVNEFSKKKPNKLGAEKHLSEALDQIKKIQNRNPDVILLESTTC